MTKERISLTIDRKLLEWIDKRVKEKLFASRSHAVEFLVASKIKEENRK